MSQIVLVENRDNPDKESIEAKDVIDISLNDFDLSALDYKDDILTNYSRTVSELYIDAGETRAGRLYCTPVYKERMSYQIWKNRINKNFLEL